MEYVLLLFHIKRGKCNWGKGPGGVGEQMTTISPSRRAVHKFMSVDCSLTVLLSGSLIILFKDSLKASQLQ